jgi:hydrogenase assembly chaperone HypC/HupF
MCLAIPSKVVEIKDDGVIVERCGERLEVNSGLMAEPLVVGDYVVLRARTHVVAKIDPQAAREALLLFNELAERLADDIKFKSDHEAADMTDQEQSNLAPRVVEMVERFQKIGELNMQGLPVYNENLQVEAIGFQPYGDNFLGVLITPWFMNVILLPQDKATMDYSLVASPTDETLPAGTWQFMFGGDDVVGLYKSLSLHSPMFAFNTQERARIEAKRRLNSLLTPPTEITEDITQQQASQNSSRRAFLRGHVNG